MQNGTLLVAIDLGSNTAFALIGRFTRATERVEYIKENGAPRRRTGRFV
jgi:cell division ATPase FtsA